MGRHTIPITNGKGSIRLVNGNYKVSAVVEGYDPDSIEPKNVTIVEGTNTYTFTIKANGTLTLHVTDTGNPQTGVQVIGAKFVRTDSTGNILSEEVITDTDGNAKFSNIPFATSGSSSISNAEKELRETYPGLKWQKGRLLNGATKEDIKKWTKK